MKRFKKIALYVVSSIVGLAILLAILAHIYEDDVKAFALKEINKHLVAEISAEDIDFSMFQRFPNASLKFKNVLLKDKNDTIIFAKNLYLKMNFWDLINEKYDVKAIEVNESKLNLSIDKYGNENYIFWKEDTTSSSESFSFNLSNVDFYDSNLKFKNEALKQSIHTKIDYLSLQGAFSEEVFSMEAKSNLLVHHFKSSGVNYITNQKCKLYTELKVDNNEKAVRVNIGDIKIADLDFVSGGYYNYNSNFMELVIQGNNINLTSLFSIFPEDYFKELTQYKSKGILTFDARIKGRSSKTETPEITAEFEINNGSITENKNDITLSNLNVLGSYTSNNKNKSSEIRLRNFSGFFEDGNFSGYLTLTNLSNPNINLLCEGNLNLNTLYRFIPSNKLSNLTGKVNFNAEINAKNTGKEIQIIKSQGTASFTDLNFTLTDNNLVFEQLNANFQLKQNHAYVTDLSGKINTTEFTIDGYFRNFLPYLLLKDEKLTIEADVWSGKTDLKLLLGASQSASSNSGNSETPNVNMSFRIRAEQIIYGKFEASNVNANVQIIDQNIYYQNLSCNTSKGTVYANGELLQLKNGNYLFSTTATTKQVDVAEFFRQLDDFGQEYLTHKNLKGLVDTDLKLQMQLDKDFNILPKTIVAAAHLNIVKGELMDVPVLNEMAQYMANEWKIKAIIDEKLFVQKIKHIRFHDLQTSVLIQDETINIPYTEVKSDLIDINGDVKHTFEHNIDYKFNFRLRDILIQKQPDNEAEFQGYEVDDKTGIRIFGQMYGTVDEPQFKFDMLSKKEYNELQREQEKQNVKAILKDELGLFKKDTTLLRQQEEQQKAKFVIDWEELDKDSTKTDSIKTNKEDDKQKKKTERNNKFLKKIGAQENKEDTVKFKINDNE